MSDSLLHEVNEDLRRERLAQFWRENGKWIIGGVILAVVLTAALTYWRGYKIGENMTATQMLLVSTRTQDTQALSALAAAEGGTHGALARLSAAAIKARAGDKAAAIALYDAVAQSRGASRVYRDLAVLLSATLQVDDGDAEKVHRMLDSLAKEKNPWRFSAYETKALLLAREGRYADAAALLTKISADPAAPQEMRARAFTFRELYMGEGRSK